MYCGRLLMLQCELMENIEDLFGCFKKSQGPAVKTNFFKWNVLEWRKYADDHGHCRTYESAVLINASSLTEYLL